jgi:hypothetical protein
LVVADDRRIWAGDKIEMTDFLFKVWATNVVAINFIAYCWPFMRDVVALYLFLRFVRATEAK